MSRQIFPRRAEAARNFALAFSPVSTDGVVIWRRASEFSTGAACDCKPGYPSSDAADQREVAGHCWFLLSGFPS